MDKIGNRVVQGLTQFVQVSNFLSSFSCCLNNFGQLPTHRFPIGQKNNYHISFNIISFISLKLRKKNLRFAHSTFFQVSHHPEVNVKEEDNKML